MMPPPVARLRGIPRNQPYNPSIHTTTGPKVMPMMMTAAVLLRRQNEGLADAAIA
jgi:hypothetical protein